MIDPKQNRVPVWLVQSIRESCTGGILHVLNAICLDQARANNYWKTIAGQHGVIKAWVEMSEANHLYGEMFRLGEVRERVRNVS